MNLGRTSSAQILTIAFLFAAFQAVRGDDVSEDDSRSQSRTSQQSAGKQTEGKVIEQPPAKTTEPWIITVGAPGWLASVSGISGFHSKNANISVDVAQILRHLNVIYTSEVEVRRGRYGALLNLYYVNGQAGQATPGLVSKMDLGLQELAGGFFASYRVIEGPRGWLDLLAGFNYTYLGEQLGLQATTWQSIQRAPGWWTISLNN